MTRNAEEIIELAMELDPEARARVAEELLRSLDEPQRQEIDAAWAEEVEERIRRYERGETKALPGDEVLKQLMARKR